MLCSRRFFRSVSDLNEREMVDASRGGILESDLSISDVLPRFHRSAAQRLAKKMGVMGGVEVWERNSENQ